MEEFDEQVEERFEEAEFMPEGEGEELPDQPIEEPAGEPVEESAAEPERVVLPSALLAQFTKQILGAGIAIIVTIVLLISFHTPQCALGFVVAAYLLYCAWALRRDYAEGKIEEISAVCSSITSMPARNASRVVFRSLMNDESDPVVYYEFYVPGYQKSNTAFVPTYIYVVYFRPTDPKKLIGYFQV